MQTTPGAGTGRQGKQVAFAGRLRRSHIELIALATAAGAIDEGAMSRRTNVVVAGETPNPRRRKRLEEAERLGTEIIDEAEFRGAPGGHDGRGGSGDGRSRRRRRLRRVEDADQDPGSGPRGRTRAAEGHRKPGTMERNETTGRKTWRRAMACAAVAWCAIGGLAPHAHANDVNYYFDGVGDRLGISKPVGIVATFGSAQDDAVVVTGTPKLTVRILVVKEGGGTEYVEREADVFSYTGGRSMEWQYYVQEGDAEQDIVIIPADAIDLDWSCPDYAELCIVGSISPW